MKFPDLSDKTTRKIAFLLFLISAFTYLYQKHSFSDSNSTNRLALCLALIEDQSVVIDRYHQFSIDICYRDGHYYCDKAPGVSFLALPFVAIGYGGLYLAGRTGHLNDYDPTDPLQPPNEFKILVVAGTIIVSLLCAVGVCVMYFFLRMLGKPQGVAVFGALLLAFATPYAIYATTLFSHSIAAAFLLSGTALGLYLIHVRKETTSPTGIVLWVFCGLIFAYSVWIEYTAAVPACLLGLSLFLSMKRQGDSFTRMVFRTCLLIAGALPVALGFFAYNTIAYGAPLELGYHFSPNFPKMDDGFFGIRFPVLSVLLQSLFSPKAGILWYSPVLFLSPFLAVDNIRRKCFPGLNFVCILISLYYFLLNSAYAYPDWRHTVASMPFLVLPIVLAWDSLVKPVRRLALIPVFLSFLAGFFAINIPLSEELLDHPFKMAFIVEMFYKMNIRNLFFYFGMPPLLSIGVLLLLWTVFGLLIYRQLVRSELRDPELLSH